MKKNYVLLLLLIISNLLVSAQRLRLATYQYADNDRIRNIQPLADCLNRKFGYTITVKSYPTVHAFIDAIQNGEADIALINTFGFLLLEASDKKYAMKPLLAMETEANAKDNYKTAFVVPIQSGIRSLADVKDVASQTSLLLVAEGSTSGNLVPRLALSGIGVLDAEKQFKSIGYGKTHIGTLEAVVNHSTDLAAMGNAEYDKLLQKDSTMKDKIRRIWLSPEIPLGPVLIGNNMNKTVRKNIIETLLALHIENAEVLESVKSGWSEARQATHYMRITGKYYRPFKNLFGSRKDLQRILKQFV